MTTVDELNLFNLKISQPKNGYRYSLDPLLLARFVSTPTDNAKIIDLGAGCGIISLVLARLYKDSSVIALEKNLSMYNLIKHNISANSLNSAVEAIHSDILNYKKISKDSEFDLVVSNPPYRKSRNGKISPKEGRDEARHESSATIEDFLSAAKYLVKPSGRISFIYLPERLAEFIQIALSMKLSLIRLRMVHNNPKSAASIFLAELAKGRKTAPIVEPPLFVRDIDGNYTDEVWR